MVLQKEPFRSTDRLNGRTAQHNLTDAQPRPSRPHLHIDLPRNSMAGTQFDGGQVPTHHSQPSSSRYDTPVRGMAQHKRKRTDTDHPSNVRHDGRNDEQRQLRISYLPRDKMLVFMQRFNLGNKYGATTSLLSRGEVFPATWQGPRVRRVKAIKTYPRHQDIICSQT